MKLKFELKKKNGNARRGQLILNAAQCKPCVYASGTYGTVKGMTPEEVKETGAQILLGNTFHLWLRPGQEVMKMHGDLHDFMNWQGPILTDSGGFQVFSLGDIRKITEEGVHFRNPVNGDKIFMDAEKSMEIQKDLGSDIVMILTSVRHTQRPTMKRKNRWKCLCVGQNVHVTTSISSKTRTTCLVSCKVVCMKICVMYR